MTLKVKTLTSIVSSEAFDADINEFIAQAHVAAPEITYRTHTLLNGRDKVQTQYIAHITYYDVTETGGIVQ